MSHPQDFTSQHSACTAAFALTVADLEQQSMDVTTEMKEAIAIATLDLARAGQRDISALARYAKSKVR